MVVASYYRRTPSHLSNLRQRHKPDSRNYPVPLSLLNSDGGWVKAPGKTEREATGRARRNPTAAVPATTMAGRVARGLGRTPQHVRRLDPPYGLFPKPASLSAMPGNSHIKPILAVTG